MTLTLLLLALVAAVVLVGAVVVVRHAISGRALEDEMLVAAEREPAVLAARHEAGDHARPMAA